MISLDLLSLAGAGAISAAFVLGRFGEAVFVVPSLATIAVATELELPDGATGLAMAAEHRPDRGIFGAEPPQAEPRHLARVELVDLVPGDKRILKPHLVVLRHVIHVAEVPVFDLLFEHG